ncbi:MAG: adenine phosphoribosyltransferase [Clostridia bacterium]|nr:adenine phosphoribosyltransferase [Clostridia bacterium]
MDKCYTIEIAGVKRDLPLCPLNEDLYIGAFVMFGDVELTVKAAAALLKKAPEFDVLITAESKGIPLLYEMARQSGNNYYIVARKGPKLYMKNIITTQVDSITTAHVQTLCIGSAEADAMRGKRVLVVDDVISTGESLVALETLINQVGGNIVGKMAVLAEGDAIGRDDITYLSPLPLFDKEGNPIK